MHSSAPPMDARQDGQLRRLHFFEQLGATLSWSAWQQKQELRDRDRRARVREAGDVRVLEVPAPAEGRPLPD